MFKRIVVAVDGSKHSQRALDYTNELATTYGSSVWIVHAFPQTSDLFGYDEYEKMVAQRELAGQAIINAAREKLDQSIDIREELLEGPAAEAILSVAEARQSSLIIMGTRGLGTLQGLLFGSVSSKVAQYASCPVMLVR